MNHIEAMKQWLEALEDATKHIFLGDKNGVEANIRAHKQCESLRQAIAEAEKQEPVGQMCIGCGSSWSDERLAQEKKKNPRLVSCCPERQMVSVFTHPQPKREPLTDKTIQNALDQAANGSHLDDVPNHNDDSIRMIAWSLENRLENMWARTKLLEHAERLEIAAIKAAHGIKENT